MDNFFKFKKFFFNKKNYVNLYLPKNVFQPNLTSVSLFNSVFSKIKKSKNKTLLDLGCGSGVIGICLKKKLQNKIELFMSDFSNKAVNASKINTKKNNIRCTVIKSNLLNNWKGKKFDYIINDIAAIDLKIAKLSRWYNNSIPHACGKDGSSLTIKILKKAKFNLKNNGKLFFPILSISNQKKILKEAKKNFKSVKILSTTEWPFPQEFFKELEGHLVNKKYGVKKFGTFICFTKIAECVK